MEHKIPPKKLNKRALESVYWRAMEHTAKGIGDQHVLTFMKSIEDSVHQFLDKQKEVDKQ